MIDSEKMITTFSFDRENQPAVQLLASSLELRKLLRTNSKLIGMIPKSVFQAVPSSSRLMAS